jgi:hypothetical protein
MAADPDKPTLSERFTRLILKADGTEPKEDTGPVTVDEIEESIARADDKERLIGLMAAPIAAAIGLVTVQTLVAHNASAYVSEGTILVVLVFALALAMLAASWFRKRLYIGITMALYGLSLVNLKFWGFGVPYMLFGSWYLVRAYRLQQKLKLAQADGTTTRRTDGSPARRVQPNKRFTPPVTGPAKPPKAPRAGTDS